MSITHGQLYHVYTRGNNRQRIFFSPQHYFYFIRKMQIQLVPVADVLAWCLMPNHVHLLLQLKKNREPQEFSTHYRVLLSSYSRGINKERGWSGSLFQQNSKFKPLDGRKGYPYICFHYIHQNPLRAGLVQELTAWPYSSIQEYVGKRPFGIVQQQVAAELLGISGEVEQFLQESALVIPEQWKGVLQA
ncbi:Transposase [Cesiribacter andamanensis AMV16]|uniref:Transposase n=2 Tax=Cesiribacter TaxID=1133570 RepID=M7N5C6_9BACT|nr:Transposase [Cesiribacter andamanensis AMV16]